MKESENALAPGKSRKKILLILIGAATGILLLLIGSGWFSTSKSSAPAAATRTAEEELEDYRTALEKRVSSLCASVSGVGDVHVAITLAGGFETIYATEVRNGAEVYATVGSGSGAEALVISRNPPAIAGIGVVCRGGDDPAIRNELTALLASAFRVPSNRIYIAGAK